MCNILSYWIIFLLVLSLIVYSGVTYSIWKLYIHMDRSEFNVKVSLLR